MKKYVVLDFDRTIFWGNIDWTINLCQIIRSKYKIIIATGRKEKEFKKEFPSELLNLFDSIVFSNGAVICNKEQTIVYPIPKENITILNSFLKGWILYEDIENNKYEIFNKNIDFIRIQVFTDNIDDYLWNLNIINSLSLSLVSDKLGVISIYASNVNKLNSAKKTLENTDYKIAKAIGDSINDISLFLDDSIEFLNLASKNSIEAKNKLLTFLSLIP